MSTISPPHSARSAALWAGVLGSPAVWAVQQEVGYALTPWVCRSGGYLAIHLLTVVCLLLAAGGGYLSWRDWKAAGRGSPDATDGGPIARNRFLGVLGLIMSAMFFLVILAQGIASFFFNACWS